MELSDVNNATTTIIFSHYGYSSYLEYSLACAKKTNPNARLIFLGDESNIDVAKKFGWEHHNFIDFQGSLVFKFNQVFRHVQGKNHVYIKGNKDWLKYVFERWFFINEFINKKSINRFWHFDSDTMILEDLSKYICNLKNYNYTLQCNGTCLNGLMDAIVVNDFCKHICELFKDELYIRAQQFEFDNINPGFAFTEMRAFDDFKSKKNHRGLHLLYFKDELIFDDVLCQSHNFDIITLANGSTVKNIFTIDGRFYGFRKGRKIFFVTLNLSWLPDSIFQWVFDSLESGCGSIADSKFSLIERLKGFFKKTMRFLPLLK